ncbi:MAG: serine/threonine-protein kinase [Planctomycetia bacterium]|nr:serine/threonine-protein kinase [Planctomycetia bacterium]
MSGHTEPPQETEPSTMLWERLSAHLERFIDAWESGTPPDVSEFLPADPPGLRRLALVELIKLDLEHRWERGERALLERYVEAFPELTQDGVVPPDLIHEEQHLRKQLEDPIEPDEYERRFPLQAKDLAQLLASPAKHATTILYKADRLGDIQVGQTLDDFDLLAQLGKGAFGTVFLARQRSMQRLVALKVTGDRGVEGQTLSQLDHPHIVRVFDQRVIPERKLRLLYMQYVAGGTLHQVADRVRRTPPSERNGKLLLTVVDQALEARGESPPSESGMRRRLAQTSWPGVICWLGARLARALDYAHQRGVLHRDIKPANVLLAADASPKLADFNISFSGSVTGASAAAYFGGSLAYMSPEQLEAYAMLRPPEDLDGRADVYSLGVMLWELLTGSRPFADTALEGDVTTMVTQMIARRKRGVDPLFIERAKAVFPEGVLDVLLDALKPDRETRYQTAGALARQLEVELQPHAQRLIRPPSRGWKQWVRRHPLLSLIACGVIPNGIASTLNITFNLNELIKTLQVDGAVEFFNNVQLPAVNGVAFPLGTLLVVILAWPLFRAFGRMRRQEKPTVEELPGLWRAALRIGDFMALVTFLEWITSGWVFPYWINARFNEQLSYTKFMTSQVHCGLLAASMTFFCATLLSVRVLLPALISPESSAEAGLPHVLSLGRRVWFYFWGTAAVIPSAFVSFNFFKIENDTALYVTAAGGMVCWMLAGLMLSGIRGDLAALAPVMSSSSDSSDVSTDGFDSFWSGTR